MKKFTIKALATSLSAIMTTTVAIQAQASDIEIYQEATAGATSLVFMLDISGSMDVRSVSEDYAVNDRGQSMGTAWINEQPGTTGYKLTTINRVGIAHLTEWGFGGRGYVREYRRIDKLRGDTSTAVREQCVLDGANYKCYARMARLQDAFYLLLNGGTDLKGNKIEKLDDNKVIGLSTLGVVNDGNTVNTGRIVVPARRLDATVGSKTQRQILTEEMSKMTARTATPTARSFAEVVAYLMGKNTTNVPAKYVRTAPQFIYTPRNNSRYRCFSDYPTICYVLPAGGTSALYDDRDRVGFGEDERARKLQWTDYPTGPTSSTGTWSNTPGYLYVQAPNDVVGESGFRYSEPTTKNGANYNSPLDGNSCAAQGVYVLTDGEPTQDSGSEGLFAAAFGEDMTCPNTGNSFFCAIEASKKLLSGNHAKKVPIKTAVVGFGDVFTKIPSYDATLTEAENLARVGVVNGNIVTSLASGDNIEQRRAAAWGIVGGGGWYSGASTQSVVKSVGQFLSTLTTDIPTMTTGSPTVPVSSLNRQTLLADAYYASFAPAPHQSKQLWTGNMNKYVTKDGALHGKDDKALFQSNGLLDVGTLGLWDASVDNVGVLGNLKLRTDQRGNVQRKIYTETVGNTRNLTQVTIPALQNGALRNSDAKHHWLNLLGYNIPETETLNFNQLSTKPELRQLGATMHSSPLLLTQSGRINRQLQEANRDDYIVYGSTQGVLHIVDADTGEERFAFVPQKMVEKQKQAFLHENATSGGKDKLFYGVDGAWVAHTEYVVRSDGTLTVGLSNPQDATSAKGRQWIYGGLRMGGKNYYGLDLTNVANSAKGCVKDDVNDKDGSKYKACRNSGQVTGEPVLKFNIDPEQTAVYSGTGRRVYSELSHMGQSWSKPALGYIRWNGQRRLVMFVGGGYDEGYETSDYNQTNGVGAGVYMFDANTGELLWWASNNTVTTPTGGVVKHTLAGDDTDSLKYSVVGRINTVDRDSDGLVDALYFGDLAGQGFRIDLNNANRRASGNTPAVPFSVRVVKLFDEHKADGTSPRFYEMPSVSVHSVTQDGRQVRVAVAAFGSGDRSSPLAGERNDSNGNAVTKNAKTADDMTAVVYDYDVGNRAWRTLTMTDLKTRHDKGGLKTAVLTKSAGAEVVVNGTNQGWKYVYPANKKGRYKSFGEPFAIADLLFVNTYDRDGGNLEGECGAGVVGVSRAYQFCLPTGLCKRDEHGYNPPDGNVPVTSNATPGLVEMTLGLNDKGIGNLGNISNVKDSTSGQNTSIDCKLQENQSKPECLNIETPSTITQLRWYEARKQG